MNICKIDSTQRKIRLRSHICNEISPFLVTVVYSSRNSCQMLYKKKVSTQTKLKFGGSLISDFISVGLKRLL